MNVHLPLDYASWQEFRLLRAKVSASTAAFSIVSLFVDLGYQAQSGADLGVLNARGRTLLEDTLKADTAASVDALVECGLLVIKAGSTDLVCSRFAKENAHLDAKFVSIQRKGARASAFVRGLQKYKEEVPGLALMIPEEIWKKEDNEKFTPGEIENVMMLVRGCDNALGCRERPHDNMGFTRELANNGFRVLKEFLPEQIDRILRKLVSEFRNHPLVPKTTEQLLAPGASGNSRFKELSASIVKE